MNSIRAIGQTQIDIRELLTDDEKKKLMEQWNRGVRKNFAGIDLFLRQNLVECIEPRRNPKEGYKPTRHMLCTRNFWMAKRLARLRGYPMKVKNKRPKSWYRNRDLLLVWDIVANDWRMIDVRKHNEWRLLDFVPFVTDDQFKAVANIWTADMKKYIPNGAGWKTYCNYIRRGV